VVVYKGAEIRVRERATASGIEYTFPLEVEATGERVTVLARIAISSDGMRSIVHVKDVPDCRRHRFADHALCMWFDADSADRKWVPSDGLDQLVAHVARHLFQEAVCRAGDPWPGEESPGAHPRPKSCTTCGGEGL
jgi:hypothetical protein